MRCGLRWFVVVGAVCGCLLAASDVGAAVPSSAAQLGACQAATASPQELFPGGTGHKIVVVRFAGQDAAASEPGRARAQALAEEIEKEIQQGMQKVAPPAAGAGDELRVRFLPCLISSAEQAREVGQGLGADLVLWGQLRAAELDLTMTVVRSRSQLVRTEQGVHRDPAAVLDLEFPRLAVAKPLPLYHALLGVHAYWFGRHAAVVDVLSQPLAPGATEGGYPSDLHRLLGRSLTIAGKPREGQVELEAALAGCKPADPTCLALVRCNLAWAADRTGDLAKAIEHGKLALTLAQQARDRLLEVMALRCLGDVYFQYPEVKQALEHFERGLRIAEELRDVPGQADMQYDIAGARAISDAASALTAYEKALALSQQLGDRDREARVRLKMAATFQGKGEFSKAEELLQQALALQRQLADRGGEASALLRRAYVVLARGEQLKAAESCEQARVIFESLGDAEGTALAFECKGDVSRDANSAGALASYEQAFALARRAQRKRTAERVLQSIGRLFDDGGDPQKADAYYDRLFFGEVRPKLLPWPVLALAKSPTNADPHLPNGIKDSLACGTVSLAYRYCVTPEGRVENVRPLHPFAEADRNIVETLARWRFTPRANVVCTVQSFSFAISQDDAMCPTVRQTPRFAAPHLIDGLRVAGQTTLPWTGQPPLSPGASHTALYRMCYAPDGTVRDIEKLRGIAGADAQLSAALRQHRIQPVQIPLCTLQFLKLSGPPKASPPSESRSKFLSAIMIRKQALSVPDPHLPDPVKTRYRGRVLTSTFKICLGLDGTVSRIDVVSGIRDADESIMRVVSDWRFQPQPVPICFIQHFEFHIE